MQSVKKSEEVIFELLLDIEKIIEESENATNKTVCEFAEMQTQTFYNWQKGDKNKLTEITRDGYIHQQIKEKLADVMILIKARKLLEKLSND
jgi:predicted transcriptional regulator